MEPTIDITIQPHELCGVKKIRITSGPYSVASYSSVELALSPEQGRELIAQLIAAVSAHAVAANAFPARAVVESAVGDALADADLPPNATVAS